MGVVGKCFGGRRCESIDVEHARELALALELQDMLAYARADGHRLQYDDIL